MKPPQTFNQFGFSDQTVFFATKIIPTVNLVANIITRLPDFPNNITFEWVWFANWVFPKSFQLVLDQAIAFSLANVKRAPVRPTQNIDVKACWALRNEGMRVITMAREYRFN